MSNRNEPGNSLRKQYYGNNLIKQCSAPLIRKPSTGNKELPICNHEIGKHGETSVVSNITSAQ